MARDTDQPKEVAVEPDVESSGDLSEIAPQRVAARVANVASPGAGLWGPMTERGRHHPIIGHGRFEKTKGLIRRVPDYWAIYGRHRVDPVFREKIMLSVSGADSSRQCSFAHREWARAAGISEADLAALEALDFESLDERTWTAIEWAQAYARSDLVGVPATLDARFRQQFNAQERADIELACRTMHWLNETSNTVDALGSRVRRKPVPGSTLLSEVIASVIYIIAVPVLIIMFSIMQRRNPISIFGRMNPFFHEFEARGPRTISGQGVAFRTRVDPPGRGVGPGPT